jgi:hypothetical protein
MLVNFKKQVTSFLGRNGSFMCKGVTVWPGSTGIWIEPITSKGQIGRCWIEIPLEDAERVGRELIREAKIKKAKERAAEAQQ